MYTSVILFHETFLTQQQEIQNTLTPETLLLPFSPVEATYSTMKQQLLDLKLEHPELQNIALFQHSEFDTFSFLGNELYPLLDVSTNDPSLEKWTTFKDFVLFLQNDLNIANFDLLMCKIFSDPNWKFVISQLESQLTTLNIRSSDDNTGHVIFDGDWILESEGVDVNMINLYFTEEILNVKVVVQGGASMVNIFIGKDMQSLYWSGAGPTIQYYDNPSFDVNLNNAGWNTTFIYQSLINNKYPQLSILEDDEIILQVLGKPHALEGFNMIRTNKNRILTSGAKNIAAWGFTNNSWSSFAPRYQEYSDICFNGTNPLLTKKIKFIDTNFINSGDGQALFLFDDGTMYMSGSMNLTSSKVALWEDNQIKPYFAREVIFDHSLLDADEYIIHAVICDYATIVVLTNKNRLFTKGSGPCTCRGVDPTPYGATITGDTVTTLSWNWNTPYETDGSANWMVWLDWGPALFADGQELEPDEKIIQLVAVQSWLLVRTDKNNLYTCLTGYASFTTSILSINTYPTKLTKLNMNVWTNNQFVNFQSSLDKIYLGSYELRATTTDGKVYLLSSRSSSYWSDVTNKYNTESKVPLFIAPENTTIVYDNGVYNTTNFNPVYVSKVYGWTGSVRIFKSIDDTSTFQNYSSSTVPVAGASEMVSPEDVQYLCNPADINWSNSTFVDLTISEIEEWNKQVWKDPNKVEVSQLINDISLVGVDASELDTLINTDLTNIDDKNGITISYINKDTDRKSFKKIMHQMFIRNTKKSIRMKKENIPMPDKTREQLESRYITSLVVTSPNTILQPSDLNSNDAFYAPLYDNGQFTEFALNDNGDKIKITKTGEDTYQIQDASGNVQNKVTDDIVRMDGLVFILGGVTAYQQSIPCFLKGTEILTTQGYKKVEDLQPGKDKLLDHNHHTLECLEVQKYTQSWNGKDFPCVIPKGAELSKEFVCTKDLYLTKNHGIYLPHLKYFYPSMRMKVKQDTTKVDKYEYFHVFTNNFFCDTIIANGIPCETHSKYVLEHIMSVDTSGRLLKTILDTCKAENDGSRKRLSKKEYNRLVHLHNKKKKTNKSSAKS